MDMIGDENVQRPEFTEKDFYLSESSPLIEYDSTIQPINAHWGQLKLAGTEILFLTDYYDPRVHKKPVVIYAGAATGDHFAIMTSLFPEILWVLYDPAKFFIEESEKIIIHNDFFNDESVIEVKKKYEGWDIFFISDIRICPSLDDPEEQAKEKEDQITEDLDMQKNWHNSLRPIISLLKFRIPFTIVESSDTFEYLPGKIMIQPFPGRLSTETRLIVSEFDRTVKYSTKWYEQSLFYHNVVVRPNFKYRPLTSEQKGVYYPEIKTDYDSMWITKLMIKFLGWVRETRKKNIDINDSTIERFTGLLIKDLTSARRKSGDHPEIQLRRHEARREVIQTLNSQSAKEMKKLGDFAKHHQRFNKT